MSRVPQVRNPETDKEERIHRLTQKLLEAVTGAMLARGQPEPKAGPFSRMRAGVTRRRSTEAKQILQ